MATIFIEIGDLNATVAAYPLRLFLQDTVGKQLLAEETIPQNLKLNGQAGDPSTFRDILLTTTSESEKFQAMGTYLFELLNQGTVRKEWEELRAAATSSQTLLEIKPQDVALLPWELACDGPDRLSLDPDHTFLRSYNYAANAHTAPYSWPLRALVVIGAADTDTAVSACDELRLIETAVRAVSRSIDIEPLKQPTNAELVAKYAEYKPHIFHFIGHGRAGSSGARLVFDLGGGGNNWSWDVDTIYNDLRSTRWLPRFAFINACRSGSAPNIADQATAWSVGDVFRRLRVPAVLTMQADVRGDTAGKFAGKLYSALGTGEPLDKALALARNHVRTLLPNGLKQREWSLPSLSLAMPSEEVLPLTPRVSGQRSVRIKNCPSFVTVAPFVNRKTDRRKFLNGFYPIIPDEGKNLIVVRGEPGAGKTWLAWWCMEGCAWQNQNIQYVDVVESEDERWLDLLFKIRDGNTGMATLSLIHEPLRAEAFYEFNYNLDYRARLKKEPDPPWNGQPSPAVKINVDLTEMGEHFPRRTIESFGRALMQAAGNQPLVIVLDRFTRGDLTLPIPHVTDFLRPCLIDPIAAGTLSPVKMVLLLTEKEFRDYKISDLNGNYQDVSLEDLPLEKFKEMAAEFLENKCMGKTEGLEELLTGWALAVIRGPWKPIALQVVYDTILKQGGR